MSQQEHQQPDSHPHKVTYAQNFLIWLSLVSLTGITVALAGIDIGRWIIVSALLIAGIKSVMVLNVFMHLRFEDKMFRVFALVAIATLAIFIILTFADYAFS